MNVHEIDKALQTLAFALTEEPKTDLGVDSAERGGDHRAAIVTGIAKGLYSSAWADDQEETHRSSGKKGLSPLSGQEITKIAPAPSASAKNAAEKLARQYEKANGKSLDDLYDDARKANGGQAEDAEMFGHYLAMMALGHGVSWFDDHKKFPLKRVHSEFHL